MNANELTQFAIKLLKLNGFEVWRQQQNSTAGRRNSVKKGVPDIIGYKKHGKIGDPARGRMIALEVKINKDKLSPEQAEFIKDLTAAGGISGVIKTPSDVEELIKNEFG